MLKAEWGLIEFVRISAPSDANLSFHISPSADVAWHSCHPPNPHFVTLPILISFSYVFLSVFLNFTFTIFPTAYFSVELANSSVFAQWDWLQIISGTVLPVEGKSPVSIFLVKLLCTANWWFRAYTKPNRIVLMPQSAVGLRLYNLFRFCLLLQESAETSQKLLKSVVPLPSNW